MRTFNGQTRGEEVVEFMNNYKNWYKSWTIWTAILQSVGAVLMIWVKLYPNIGWLLVLKSIIDIILRKKTYKAIK